MRLGREKILVVGDPKVGKTRAVATFARGLPNSKFVILETDDGWVKVAAELGLKVAEVTKDSLNLPTQQVALFRPIPQEWLNYHACIERIDKWITERKLGPDDWIITEGLDIVLDEMRGEFSDKTAQYVISKSDDKKLAPSSWNAYLAKRNKGAPILEGSDYDAIYSEFRSALNYLALQMPCNWIATSGIEAIRREGQYKDSQEEQEFYAGMGMPVKVAGYKQVPRKVDTVILLGKNLATGYNFRVYGDRGGNLRGQESTARTVPQSRVNNDLFQDYLVKMVGWTVSQSAVYNGAPPPVT